MFYDSELNQFVVNMIDFENICNNLRKYKFDVYLLDIECYNRARRRADLNRFSRKIVAHARNRK